MKPTSPVGRDKRIKGGSLIIKGTRLRVSFIVELAASGYKIKDIKKIYPYLSEETIKNTLNYVADNVDACK
jgi:uncharacterized protein (DUF433 family)